MKKVDKLTGRKSDFSKASKALVKQQAALKEAGKSTLDDRIDWTRGQVASEEYLSDNKLVWHHFEDGKTMQAIPATLNSQVRYTGGAAILRKVN